MGARVLINGTRYNPLYAPLARGLDAGHKATGLIIAAGLRTAQRAARSVASEISENCIAPVVVGPNTAGVAADVAQGWRSVNRRRPARRSDPAVTQPYLSGER